MRTMMLVPPLLLALLACGGFAEPLVDVDPPSAAPETPDPVPEPAKEVPTSRCGSDLHQIDYWQGEYPGAGRVPGSGGRGHFRGRGPLLRGPL
jgi:hypothetical protein